MSISGLNIGTKALQAHMAALEITGQNIANVNNTAYTRQRAKLSTDITVTRPWGQEGTGVTIDQIQQMEDEFIDRQIREQTSDTQREQILFDGYERLQNIYSEGAGYGLNERLGEFFNAFQDLASFPEDSAMRAAVLGEATTLTSQMQFLNAELDQLRTDTDTQVQSMVTEANSLLQQIASYNTDIASIEAGTTNVAADIRDKRREALIELSEYLDISVHEMDSGAVNVTANGRTLVYSGEYNQLDTTVTVDDDLSLHNVVMEGTTDALEIAGGKIGGALELRDTTIATYRDNLDELARSLIAEVNKIHSDGRGLSGFSTITGANAVSGTTTALSQAGLPITPTDGSFQIILTNSATGAEETYTITVDLDGSGSDATLSTLSDAIDDESAFLTATANSDGTLTITASSGYTFQFANDDTNILAALGINSFFTGTDAETMSVSQDLIDTPALLAAAQSGNPGDNSNALAIAQLRNSMVLDNGSQTFEGFYQSEISRLGSEAQQKDIAAQANTTFLSQLQLRRESVSGVSLDEETANLIKYQQGYQAAARFISVMNEMLNVLVNGLV